MVSAASAARISADGKIVADGEVGPAPVQLTVDVSGVRSLDLSCSSFVGWGEPIGCGGVAIFPDDIIVADQDGAVVIPKAFLDLVLAEGAEQERMEAWIVDQVNAGAALPGLYPMNAETKARYAASKP